MRLGSAGFGIAEACLDLIQVPLLDFEISADRFVEQMTTIALHHSRKGVEGLDLI